MGIDAVTLPRVFDLFTQAERSLDRSLGGLGIGLTLVRALTEQHGGAVAAHSDGAGRGSEFIVRLPISCKDTTARPRPALLRAPSTIPLCVLVVDDNVEGAETLAMLFEAWGHAVHTVHDGLAALEAVRSLRPDIVFLDIGLPRMNGYDVAMTICAELGEDAPLLAAITGYGQSEDRRRAEAAGFQHHLVKPVSPDDLLRVFADAQAEPSGKQTCSA